MQFRTIVAITLLGSALLCLVMGCDPEDCPCEQSGQDSGCYPENRSEVDSFADAGSDAPSDADTGADADSDSPSDSEPNTATVPGGTGTPGDPIVITCAEMPCEYEDSRDTRDAPSDRYDSYPPSEVDESGPEFIYVFTVKEEVRISANIDFPEPTGVDVDIHLLSSLDPLQLISRDHYRVYAVLQPGTYYLSLDTYVNSSGDDLRGPYDLRVSIRPRKPESDRYFNRYILGAVDFLYDNYGLLGYSDTILTHEIEYGSHGIIEPTGGARTMCVAAVMEVILTAMQLYAADTGDTTVWDYLPIESWERLSASDIKAHIWVNFQLGSSGTGDALSVFGMGETVDFESLLPGSFVNLNRLSGSGHAVVFLSYIDEEASEYDTYHDNVIGFRYFSSQGGYDIGAGGLDYRYAIFATDAYEQHGYPSMPYKRDLHIVRSDDQQFLNTGMMWHPEHWDPTIRPSLFRGPGGRYHRGPQVSFFDAEIFTGITADDDIDPAPGRPPLVRKPNSAMLNF